MPDKIGFGMLDTVDRSDPLHPAAWYPMRNVIFLCPTQTSASPWSTSKLALAIKPKNKPPWMLTNTIENTTPTKAVSSLPRSAIKVLIATDHMLTNNLVTKNPGIRSVSIPIGRATTACSKNRLEVPAFSAAGHPHKSFDDRFTSKNLACPTSGQIPLQGGNEYSIYIKSLQELFPAQSL